MQFYLLGLCGSKGVGKDTAFEELYKSFRATESFEYTMTTSFAFADRLKEMLSDFFKSAKIDIKTCSRDVKEVVRPLLIELGETGRRVDADFWVLEVFEKIKNSIAEYKRRYCGCTFDVFFVIKDVRYANEIHKILDVREHIPEIKLSSVIRLLRDKAPIVEKTEKRSFAEIERVFDLPSIDNNFKPDSLGSMMHLYCQRMKNGCHDEPYVYTSWFDKLRRKWQKLWQR